MGPQELHISDHTVNRTGEIVKDVRMTETRRMLTTTTRLMMMTLLTNRVGTTDIEDNAFRMVRERVQRSYDPEKKKEFQKYPRLTKREKVKFLVE